MRAFFPFFSLFFLFFLFFHILSFYRLNFTSQQIPILGSKYPFLGTKYPFAFFWGKRTFHREKTYFRQNIDHIGYFPWELIFLLFMSCIYYTRLIDVILHYSFLFYYATVMGVDESYVYWDSGNFFSNIQLLTRRVNGVFFFPVSMCRIRASFWSKRNDTGMKIMFTFYHTICSKTKLKRV